MVSLIAEMGKREQTEEWGGSVLWLQAENGLEESSIVTQTLRSAGRKCLSAQGRGIMETAGPEILQGRF